MTVASEVNRSGPYTGNGVTTTFDYGFRILDEGHIKVVRSESGAETTLTLGTDYTVSGVGDTGGGSITMTFAPTAAQKLAILRAVPFTQEVDLENQGAYFAETVEAALDLAAMRDQELKERADRALRVSEASSYPDLTVPEPEAGKYLKWKQDLSGLENSESVVFPPEGYPIATQSEAEAGVANDVLMTPLRTAQLLGETAPFASMSDLLNGETGKTVEANTIFQLLLAPSLIQNNAVDPTNDIDVLLDGVHVVTKRLDANWAAGTNQGGLDTGAKANSATYHVWMLRNDTTGALDANFSVQALNPVIPPGYTRVRCLGAILTDAAGVIRPFLQCGDIFTLLTTVSEGGSLLNGVTCTLRDLTGIPSGVKVKVRAYVGMLNAGGAGGYLSLWDADLGPDAVNQNVLVRVTGSTETGALMEFTASANRQVYTADTTGNTGTAYVNILTHGWQDFRVRRNAI